MNRQRLLAPYMWSMITLGAFLFIYSALNLQTTVLDVRFVVLAVVTVGIGSRIGVSLPRIGGEITVSDTFIFLTMLLYGGEPAILLAGVEAFCSALRFSKRARTILFNAAVMTCSSFLTVWTIRFGFTRLTDLANGEVSATLVMALCVMALVQYVSNSGLAALHGALKTDEPFWRTWQKHYLWTSVTYFAGASAAGVIAKLVGALGFYASIVTMPIILIVYMTYRTYLKNIEVSFAQAQQAETHVQELSRYIAEQEQMREQLMQFEKLSALGELASGVAHDFNNTLAGILGRAQLMQRTSNPEKINRGLEIIIKTAEDGAKITKRIQDFARQRRDHDFAVVAIDQILLDASEFTRPRWKNQAEAGGVRIDFDLCVASQASVMGDDTELREVLVNMIINAVDAMPQGGKLTLSSALYGDRVEIRVSDTGVGMNAEVQSRIFDPFYTTKGKAGLGLGLAVSYGVISRHAGTIVVESEIERGTTFRITLPVAAAEQISNEIIAAQTAAHNVPAQDDLAAATVEVRRRPRFLVVDDEPLLRELLSEMLDGDGYDVVLAEDGHTALALFEREQFDAVFTDVGMPGMNGWELARSIRERDGSVPLAVITGWGEAVGSDEQRAARVDWVVTKPFSAPRVSELAREAVALRQTRTSDSNDDIHSSVTAATDIAPLALQEDAARKPLHVAA